MTHGVLRGSLPRGGLDPLQTPCHACSSTRHVATRWTESSPDALPRMVFYEERCHVVDWVHSRRFATHGVLRGALPRGGLSPLQTPCHACSSTWHVATRWTESSADALPRMEFYACMYTIVYKQGNRRQRTSFSNTRFSGAIWRVAVNSSPCRRLQSCICICVIV